MGKRDWDCKQDGHVPVSKMVKSSGLRKVVRLTWCAVCGRQLKG